MWRDDRIDSYRDSRDYSSLLGTRGPEPEYEPSKSRQDSLRRQEAIRGILKSKAKARSSDPGPSVAPKRVHESHQPKKELPFDKSFGSFFGPSQPIVVKRVLEEDRNRHEARLQAAKMAKQSNQAKQRQVSSSSKTVVKTQKPVKSLSKTEYKIQKLKEARDYSFLFSENDDAVPQSKPAASTPKSSSRPSSAGTPTSSTRPRPSDTTTAARRPINAGVRPAQSAPPSRPALKSSAPSSSLSRPKPSSDVSRRPVSSNARPAAVSQTKQTSQSASKPRVAERPRPPVADRPRPPVADRARPPPVADRARPSNFTTRVVARPSNGTTRPVGTTRPGAASNGSVRQSLPNGSRRPEPSARAVPSSNGSARPPLLKQKPLPAKRPRSPSYEEEEDVDYRKYLPKQFRMDYKRRYDDDGYDSSDMEADFHTIQAEEARSSRIARQEDEEELAKIQQEERLENLRKKQRR